MQLMNASMQIMTDLFIHFCIVYVGVFIAHVKLLPKQVASQN